MGFTDLLCKVEHLLYYFLIGKHSVEIAVHSTLHDFTEFFRFYEVSTLIDMHLFCNQTFQQLNGKVLFLHLRDFLQEFRIKQREILFLVREKVDNAITLDTLLQKLIDFSIDFGERQLFTAALIENTHQQDTDSFKESGFFSLIFLCDRGTQRKCLFQQQGFFGVAFSVFLPLSVHKEVDRTCYRPSCRQLITAEKCGVVKFMEQITAYL